jgi:hypothetical protein
VVFAATLLNTQHWREKPKTYNSGICCYSAKHTALKSKTKGLSLNQDNKSELSDMSTCRLLFQWASTISWWCWSST